MTGNSVLVSKLLQLLHLCQYMIPSHHSMLWLFTLQMRNNHTRINLKPHTLKNSVAVDDFWLLLLVPHELWNTNVRVQWNLPITNITLERWHNHIASIMDNADISKFTKELKEDNSLNQMKIVHDLTGMENQPQRTKLKRLTNAFKKQLETTKR